MTVADNKPIAILGTGGIGTAIAKTLSARGRTVRVWNRAADRTSAAVDGGAAACASPAEAAAGAALTLVTVTDYDAVTAVLDLLGPVKHGPALAVLTTGSSEQARDAAHRATSLGYAYLDAGVQTSPQDIGTGRGTMLFAGDQAAFEAHRKTLETLAGTRFVSTSPDAAAVWDLALFGVWYDAQLGLLRALDLARRHGIDAHGFAETASVHLDHAASAAVSTAEDLLAGDYPRRPANLEEHLPVIRQLVEIRTTGPLGDGGIAQIGARTQTLIDLGYGSEGLTALLRQDP